MNALNVIRKQEPLLKSTNSRTETGQRSWRSGSAGRTLQQPERLDRSNPDCAAGLAADPSSFGVPAAGEDRFIANFSSPELRTCVATVAIAALERGLLMRIRLRHGSPKCETSEYGDQKDGHPRRLPCWFAARFQQNRRTTF